MKKYTQHIKIIILLVLVTISPLMGHNGNYKDSMVDACTAVITSTYNCNDQNWRLEVTISGCADITSILYNWTFQGTNLGVNSAVVTVNEIGSYIVEIEIGMGMDEIEIISEIEVEEYQELMVSLESTNLVCAGTTDGEATVNVIGGVPPYSYEWSHDSQQMNAFVDNLGEGDYSVTVTDATNGCTEVASNTMAALLEISLSTSQTNVSCNGGSDGQATVLVTGGTDLSYDWGIGGNTSTISNLSKGVYMVTVTYGISMCETSTAVTITEPFALTSNFNKNDVRCKGESNGSAMITGNGGTSPYTYLWSTGAITQEITGLNKDDYGFIITDAHNCTVMGLVEITEPVIPLTASISINNHVKCNGGNDGSVTAIGNGGWGNYSYIWDNGQGQVATTLNAGVHTVTVTDGNGCPEIETVTITEPAVLLANIEVIKTIPCEENGEGQLEVSISGGTELYMITWQGGQTETIAMYSDAGEYSVTITDNNGCIANDIESLSLDPAFQISEYPTSAAFKNKTAQDLNYMVSSSSSLHWKIIKAKCIDTTDVSYINSGETTESLLDFTFVLENNRVPGTLVLEVHPEDGICIGDAVQTEILVSPNGNPVFVPEIFSPNGDGQNDEWEIVFPENASADDYSITVFSRNGRTVYEANSMTNLWRGEGCSDGAYYYVIIDEISKQKYTGGVSLLR